MHAIAEVHAAWARIDLDRLARNYNALLAHARVPLMPVVKAEAYGHGAPEVARRLEAWGAPALSVAFVQEGRLLRAAGVRAPIVVLSGFVEEQWPLLREHALTPVLTTPAMVRVVRQAATQKAWLPAVHLKVDTGLGRLGFTPEEAIAAARELHAAGVAIEGLMTHLAVADEDARLTGAQLDRFDRVIAALAEHSIRPRWIHAANSAGLAYLRPTHTLARPGLMLYGVTTRPLAPAVKVEPVMTVAARILLLKDIPAGTSVSYGARWTARRPSRIATIPLGYADGVPRTEAMAARGFMRVGTERARVAGTVCMDFTMLDATELESLSVDSEVVLMGDEPSAWDLAEWAGTTAWQALTSIGARLPRVYVEQDRIASIASQEHRP
ncbi:MAG: alanine racemase [Vicinamibacteria bacterium]|nr:alanine racemase [Vicinamibacteria bacterium]